MKRTCENIYKSARVDAGLTQEKAAEMLFISTRSLCDYESGKTIPPEDVVSRMVDVYDSPRLGYQHLKQNNIVGRRLLPDLKTNDLPRAVLRLQKRH